MMPPPVCPQLNPLASRMHDALPMRVSGRVAAVTGGTVEIEGMTAPIGAICRITTTSGEACDARLIGFRGVRPLLAPLGEPHGLAAGDAVQMIAPSMRIRVGVQLAGRVIDALGRPIDGRPLPDDLVPADVQRAAPQSLDRPSI